MNYQLTQFLVSVADVRQLSDDIGAEIAFVGRSNAGKSSAINKITGNKKLAKVSKTPGRTQMINLFKVDDDCRFADLPGYGYAKVSRAMQVSWGKMIRSYLEKRRSLCGLVLIMDARHPLKPTDRELIRFAKAYDISVHILLTKADKLSRNLAKTTLLKVRKELSEYGKITAQLFSSFKEIGLDEMKALLDNWFLNNLS